MEFSQGGIEMIAVILFPGTNCEWETKRACEEAGMEADIIRWNSGEDLETYKGFILPGGFSYEDRVRAGIVASKDSLMKQIKEEAEKGKPVLGICNGAQVLIETGMVPGSGSVEMALAPNINPRVGGYYCTWVNLRSSSPKARSAFNNFDRHVTPMPIAHAEGRFASADETILEKLKENNQIIFRYSTKEGEVRDEFPINPNGSLYNIAGICNPDGNVLAMMPHPERASWARQIPGANGDGPGPGLDVFLSMKKYIERGF
jgi:phosphoribosylformylglycinamidine synthase